MCFSKQAHRAVPSLKRNEPHTHINGRTQQAFPPPSEAEPKNRAWRGARKDGDVHRVPHDDLGKSIDAPVASISSENHSKTFFPVLASKR